MQLTPVDPEDRVLFPIDRMNAQKMRWRLRKDMCDRSLEEGDRFKKLLEAELNRLWTLLPEVGTRYPLGGRPPATRPEDENIASSLYEKLKDEWDLGKLRYFTLSYIQKAANQYVKDEKTRPPGHRSKFHNSAAGSSEPIENAGEDRRVESGRSEEDWFELRNFFEAAFKKLDRDEAYMLGALWGNPTKQGEAARAIGKDDAWASRVKARLVEKLQREAGRIERRERNGGEDQ